MIIGYARVSSIDQNLERQLDNLTTVEYHELLAYFHFKSEANPSKVEYKRAYKDVCAILKK